MQKSLTMLPCAAYIVKQLFVRGAGPSSNHARFNPGREGNPLISKGLLRQNKENHLKASPLLREVQKRSAVKGSVEHA